MRGSSLFVAVTVALTALCAGSPTGAQTPPTSGLAAALAIDTWHHELTDDIAITFTLTNTGAGSARILRWQTPLAGIEADILAVTVDGEPVPYVGRLIKRAAPEAEDWIELGSGQSVSAAFDLSSVYDMTRRGEYAVRYRTELPPADDVEPPELPAGSEEAPENPLESNEVRLWVEGGELAPTPEVEPDYLGGTTNCTNTQKSKLTTALTNATSMSTKAHNYLVGSGNSTLYRYWFGAYTSSRLATVKSHFSAIKTALASKPITFDCGCTANYYAYVYPTKPYKVYVCKAFWTAPATGRDSRAGTVVHEVSHFNVVATTQDYVYGATAAHGLALTSPTKAVKNADNHEYFAEDQP
ncbi:MAG: peptidase M35 [Acidobacteria bacterium]|nr:peptidase M35 [Acidobacteriota bacterium]